jgi:hypothetical protein
MYAVVRQHVIHLMFELPEDGTDVPKHRSGSERPCFKCMSVNCTLTWFYK